MKLSLNIDGFNLTIMVKLRIEGMGKVKRCVQVYFHGVEFENEKTNTVMNKR